MVLSSADIFFFKISLVVVVVVFFKNKIFWEYH